MTELRILQFILTLEHGGAQQMLLDTCLQWQHQGVYVCVCSFEDGPIRHLLENNHIEVQLLQPKHATIINLPAFFYELKRIRKAVANIINSKRINILQTHLLSVYDFVTPSLLGDCPTLEGIIWTFHNTRLEFEPYSTSVIKRWVYRALYRYLVKYTTFVVAISESVQQFLIQDIGLSEAKILIFHNALSMKDYMLACDNDYLQIHNPNDATILLTVGRLVEQKGHHYLLNAMPQIIASCKDVILFIVGDGEKLADLQEQAHVLEISDSVYFLGYRSDVPQLLACADLFILSSIYEGLPRVVLEAMASQTPIIASNIAGVWDVLQDGYNARLAPPLDSKSLAEAILELIENPNYAEQLSKNALIDVKARYDIQQLATQYLEAFEQHILK